MNKIKHLEGLRGFAALQVVLIHYFSFFLPAQQCSLYWTCWQQDLRDVYLFFAVDGIMAVSIFFILSGYILARSFERTRSQPLQNIFKRYVRLQIPIALALLIAFLLYLLGQGAYLKAGEMNHSLEWTGQFFAIPPTFFSFINEAFWSSLLAGYENISVFAGFGGDFFAGAQSLNPPLWSLNIEFWGSMLIILLAYLRPYKSLHHLLLFVCFVLLPMNSLILFVLGYLFAQATRKTDDRLPSPNHRAANIMGLTFFMIGVLISSWRENIIPLDLYGALNSLMIFKAQTPFHFAGMLGAIFVFAGVLFAPCLQKLFALTLFEKLGRVSFSLYLLHVPIMLAITAPLQLALGAWLGHAAAAVLAFLLGLAITFALAALFCRFVDEPAMRLSRRLAKA